MEITRTGIRIWEITIHFYGVILMLGAVAGAILADREARRRKFNPDLVWVALIWLLIGGVVGLLVWLLIPAAPVVRPVGDRNTRASRSPSGAARLSVRTRAAGP